jgi:hypothetical protein
LLKNSLLKREIKKKPEDFHKTFTFNIFTMIELSLVKLSKTALISLILQQKENMLDVIIENKALQHSHESCEKQIEELEKEVHALKQEIFHQELNTCRRCEPLPVVEEAQELDPRYVTWEQLAKAYEHSASKKWNILEMATYLRSLSKSNKEEFDGCSYAECVCATLYHLPTTECLAKMPEKQELAWRKKIME